MDDKLTELIREGPDKRYTMKALVLERFDDINRARQLMRTWADIAEALGLGRSRGKDLAGCFARVGKGVRAGKLLAGKSGSGFHTASRNGVVAAKQDQNKPVSKSGIIDLDDPANQ